MKPEISIVIPAYNEEESLPALFESLYPVMRDMGRPFEIIFTSTTAARIRPLRYCTTSISPIPRSG